jgi:hypothetical protein
VTIPFANPVYELTIEPLDNSDEEGSHGSCLPFILKRKKEIKVCSGIYLTQYVNDENQTSQHCLVNNVALMLGVVCFIFMLMDEDIQEISMVKQV